MGASVLPVRIRNNFQLAIILLFGVIALLAILPFAIYRFVTGDLLAGVIDTAILVCIASAVIYAWRGGHVATAGIVVMVTSTVGCLAIGVLFGLPGLLWMSPILLANFLMIDRWKAFLIAVLAMLFIVVKDGLFASTQEAMMFVTSASVTILFSLVFASRTESQRLTLESLAAHDTLTGAQNRMAMERSLGLVIQSRRRGDPSAGLAMLDLDHFKTVNDRYGHEAGDRVLSEFAVLVRRHIRRSDSLFRYGGEEFVLLLPGVDETALTRICEDVRAGIERDLRRGDIAVTVSIGAATLGQGEDWQAWLGRADAAMYRAKRGGRNRLETAIAADGGDAE